VCASERRGRRRSREIDVKEPTEPKFSHSLNAANSDAIVPNAGAPNADVANLYRYSSKGRTATWVFIGQYYNTFRIDVTNP